MGRIEGAASRKSGVGRDCEFAAAPGSGLSSCWPGCPMAAVSAPWERAVAARTCHSGTALNSPD